MASEIIRGLAAWLFFVRNNRCSIRAEGLDRIQTRGAARRQPAGDDGRQADGEAGQIWKPTCPKGMQPNGRKSPPLPAGW